MKFMLFLKILFFGGIFIIFYSYIGYGILLWILLKIRKLFGLEKKTAPLSSWSPPVTLIVAAYNEEHFIAEKINNTLSLQYPREQLDIIFITDGSTDQTSAIVGRYPEIKHLHETQRNGKIAAIHRAMSHVRTPIVIFSDANTLLNADCIQQIVRHYQDPKTGGVAGEKKVIELQKGEIAGAGEGLYWKYESFLKKMDSDFYTVVGAAGELFSIRTELYEYPGRNILLDDFLISLRICQKKFRVAYEPGAYAMETPSSSLHEEQKRKVRISAGAFQSMIILRSLLNIFRYPLLSFQYISHRVLRWTLCPLFLPIVFISNIFLLKTQPQAFYQFFMAAQVLFYAAGLAGWLLSLKKIRISVFYVAYYFIFINISLYLGFFRFIKGSQSVLWEKASREAVTFNPGITSINQQREQ